MLPQVLRRVVCPEDVWPPPFVHALCAAAILPRFLQVPANTFFTQFAPMFDVPLEMR